MCLHHPQLTSSLGSQSGERESWPLLPWGGHLSDQCSLGHQCTRQRPQAFQLGEPLGPPLLKQAIVGWASVTSKYQQAPSALSQCEQSSVQSVCCISEAVSNLSLSASGLRFSWCHSQGRFRSGGKVATDGARFTSDQLGYVSRKIYTSFPVGAKVSGPALIRPAWVKR